MKLSASVLREISPALPGIEPGTPGSSFTATLPYPPTVNTYWRHAYVHGRVMTYVSGDGKAYRQEVLAMLNVLDPLTGPLVFHATFYPPDNRKRDLDNLPKALLDALQAAGVFADDSQIRESHTAFGPVRKGGCVEVRIETG